MNRPKVNWKYRPDARGVDVTITFSITTKQLQAAYAADAEAQAAYHWDSDGLYNLIFDDVKEDLAPLLHGKGK